MVIMNSLLVLCLCQVKWNNNVHKNHSNTHHNKQKQKHKHKLKGKGLCALRRGKSGAYSLWWEMVQCSLKLHHPTQKIVMMVFQCRLLTLIGLPLPHYVSKSDELWLEEMKIAILSHSHISNLVSTIQKTRTFVVFIPECCTFVKLMFQYFAPLSLM